MERVEQQGTPGEVKQEFVPFPVSSDLINRAKTGDQDAFTEIDAAVRSKLQGYFYLRLPEEAEDLAQITTTRIATRLDRFNPHEDVPFADQFTYWCFAIAKNTLNSGLRDIVRRNGTFIPRTLDQSDVSTDTLLSTLNYHYGDPELLVTDETTEASHEHEENPDPRRALNQWFEENLTERQQYIVRQREAGLQNPQIAEELGLHPRFVKSEVGEIRRKLEGELLNPAGLRLVSDFRDDTADGLDKNALNDALTKQRLKAVKILGRYYTTPEIIDEYLGEKRSIVDQAKASEGLLFLGDHASQNEYSSILRNPNYRNLVVFQNGRPFIRPEDLEEVRRKRARRVSTTSPRVKINPPIEGYERLTDIAITKTEYARYRTAILEGRIESIREGKTLFVRRESITDYNLRLGANKNLLD